MIPFWQNTAGGSIKIGELKADRIARDSVDLVRRLCTSLAGLLDLYHSALHSHAPVLFGTCPIELHAWRTTAVATYAMELRASLATLTQVKWTTRVYVYGALHTHHFAVATPRAEAPGRDGAFQAQWPARVQADIVYELLERARHISDASLASAMLSNLTWVHTVTARGTGDCLLLLVHGVELVSPGLRSVAGTLLSLVGDS